MLIVTQPVKKCPAFYGIRKFITCSQETATGLPLKSKLNLVSSDLKFRIVLGHLETEIVGSNPAEITKSINL
jgi:hypothetical protein